MSIWDIHIRMIKRNTLKDYFATLRFCFTFFDWRTALRLPVYVTPLVQYKRPKDKHRIILEKNGKETQPANLLIGYLDREYSWDRPSLINIQGELHLHGGKTSYFAPGVSLYIAENGYVALGEGFTASHNLRIFATKEIIIGNDNMWSYDCVVLDSDVHELSYAKGGGRIKPVLFGNHIWMGARNVVLKGAEVPDGAMLGANQSLRKSYKGYVAPMIAGDEVIKEHIVWRRDFAKA